MGDSDAPERDATLASKPNPLYIILPIAVALLIAVFVFLFPIFMYGKPYVYQTSQPLSLEEARELCPIELPAEASEIQIALYYYARADVRYVRFKAPLEICKQHARKLLEAHNARESVLTPIETELRHLSNPPERILTDPELPVDWLDVHNINKGWCGGPGGSHTPQIWIDEERELFYYKYTD